MADKAFVNPMDLIGTLCSAEVGTIQRSDRIVQFCDSNSLKKRVFHIYDKHKQFF